MSHTNGAILIVILMIVIDIHNHISESYKIKGTP